VKRILITNDDGYRAKGLFPLIEALIPLGEVTVVVPRRNCSAGSHAITLDTPIHLQQNTARYHGAPQYILDAIKRRFYIVSGTSADCVRLGYMTLMKQKIDLVVAGINDGANLGLDIIYSSTVAAAREAAIEGIPSVALSLISEGDPDFSCAQVVSHTLCKRLLGLRLPRGIYCNVNIPGIALDADTRIMPAELGFRKYGRNFCVKKAARKGMWYTLYGEVKKSPNTLNTDVSIVGRKHIAFTPIPLSGDVSGLLRARPGWLKSLLRPLWQNK
jgi:5'-nucleotidase